MARAPASRRKSVRRGTRARSTSSDHARRVHEELLQEAQPNIVERPLKRRRVAEHLGNADETKPHETETETATADAAVAALEDDSDSSSSDGSDSDEGDDEQADQFDWVQHLTAKDDDIVDKAKSKDSPKQQQEISLELESPKRSRRDTRRLPSSTAAKTARLNVHKLHVCALLAHAHIRSGWCNNAQVQKHMRKMLSKDAIQWLQPAPELLQQGQKDRFKKGLQVAIEDFKRFSVDGPGMSRSHWAVTPEELDQTLVDEDDNVDKTAFVKAAQSRNGTRDTAAQLFCAMLRSVGVDARLVCSLQPLPLAKGPPADNAHDDPGKRGKQVIDLSTPAPVASNTVTEETRRGIRRLRGGRNAESFDLGVAPRSPPPEPSKPKKSRRQNSKHPVFWVEAFRTVDQTWIPVDPIATKTILLRKTYEPPARDALNSMTYVVAFEGDGTARDVTRRYAQAYNAKTRRNRVETTTKGKQWFRRVMRMFSAGTSIRDQIEDAELTKFESQEPMPRSLEDFKDHPIYALERHLRVHEIIDPKKEVGKVTVSNKSEPVYRRANVKKVLSQYKWYRQGRNVVDVDHPHKRVRARGTSRSSPTDSEDAVANTVGLYSEDQTEVYKPDDVNSGRVPKNRFGRLDVFVPSMIPAGAVHVRASDAVLAAKTLEIDYSQAVVGTSFRKGQVAQITRGVLVARQFAEAMEDVILGLRSQQLEQEAKRRSAEMMKIWKRMLLGLRVRARLIEEHGSVRDEGDKLQAQIDEAEQRDEKQAQEGGFMPGQEASDAVQPTAGSAAEEIVEGALAPPLPSNWFFEKTISSPWDASPRVAEQEQYPVKAAIVDEEMDGGFIREDEEQQVQQVQQVQSPDHQAQSSGIAGAQHHSPPASQYQSPVRVDQILDNGKGSPETHIQPELLQTVSTSKEGPFNTDLKSREEPDNDDDDSSEYPDLNGSGQTTPDWINDNLTI